MKIEKFTYSDNEWLFIRVSFAVVWACFAFPSIWSANEISVPVGISQFIPLQLFLWKPIKWLVLIFACYLLVNYCKNQKLLLSTLGLSVLSIIIFTLEESSGVFSRVSLLSTIWMAQCMAVFLYRNESTNLAKHMIHFSIQLVSVSYMLSAYSKWTSSGLHWVSDGKYIDLQILKSFYFHWTDNGSILPILQGEKMIHVMHDNQLISLLVLWFSLILETLAFCLVFSKKWAKIFGVLLLSMHIGIFVIMGGILIVPVIAPMLIFTLNPFYLLWEFILKTRNLIWKQ